jgi:hypothetical protein
MIENIKDLVLVGLGAFLIGGFAAGGGVWYVTDHYKDMQATVVQKTLEAQTSDKVLGLTQIKDQAVLDLATAKGKIDSEYKANITSLQGRVNKLAADNKRLRDPGYQSGCTTTGNNSNCTNGSNGSSAGAGLLSEQTSKFLWNYAGEADSYVERLRQCKAWSDSLTVIINTQNDQIKALNDKKSASSN